MTCSVLCGIQTLIDAVADPRGGGSYGVSGQMWVPGGRLRLRVIEQFSHHRQPFVQREGPAGEAGPVVVNSHVLQPALARMRR